MRARYYQARRGCWDSPDPVGYRGGDWNLRRYVGNGPVGNVDPSGLGFLDGCPSGWTCVDPGFAWGCSCCRNDSGGGFACAGSTCSDALSRQQGCGPAPPPPSSCHDCEVQCVWLALGFVGVGSAAVSGYQGIVAGVEAAASRAAIKCILKGVAPSALVGYGFCLAINCSVICSGHH